MSNGSRMKPLGPIRAEILALAQLQPQPLGLPLVLIDALARDVWLEHIHGIETGRATRGVDLTVVVDSWDAFTQLKKALVDTGRFAPVANTNHCLRFDAMHKDIDQVMANHYARPHNASRAWRCLRESWPNASITFSMTFCMT